VIPFAIALLSGEVLEVRVQDTAPIPASGQQVVALNSTVEQGDPLPGYTLTVSNFQLVWEDRRSLEEVRQAKFQEIDSSRLAANQATFSVGGKSFKVDPLSRSDIDGVSDYVALFDELPPNWPGGWRATDGTIYPIGTVAEWRDFVAAMVVQGVAHFLYSESLKAAANAADTNSAIEAISW
jgi:hypothetical protein